MSDGNRGMTAFLSFLLGAVVGAGLALFYAPQSGKETRRRVREFSDKVGDDIREGYEKVSEKAKPIIDKAKEAFRKKGEI